MFQVWVFLFGSMFPVICNVLITQWQNLSGCKLSYLCWLQWNCGNLHFTRICHLDSCQIQKSLHSNLAGEPLTRGNTEESKRFSGLKILCVSLICQHSYLLFSTPQWCVMDAWAIATDEIEILPQSATVTMETAAAAPRAPGAGGGIL